MDTFVTLLELACQIFTVLCDLFVLAVFLEFAWMFFG